ncbi:MAG: prepilin-type N-terminal cleavage/methylation domain-containing protein [Verrucomicrobiales bacterium]|jgi:prepilin-type processing-associated H-X9-DG protein|nr:prepilin-type N-terminal cleavage/methylation domain-containing protein [Verrucomicrobiales bacterium]
MKRHSEKAAFTVIELIVTVFIIALLFSLSMPSIRVILGKADSIACVSNLQQIGLAVQGYAQDNDGNMPMIETDPSNPVYPSGSLTPDNTTPVGLYDTLKDYGITQKNVQCPSDLKANNYYLLKGSSYEWRPYADDEPINNPQVYFRNNPRNVSSSRIRICQDFSGVHNGRMNAVYCDGHVTKPK